jgi:Ca-activated chloride channel family protein
MALVTYSNSVRIDTGLMPVDSDNRTRLAQAVNQVHAGGGTNLGGGLKAGIDLLLENNSTGRRRKVILVSDGLANHGITDPYELGRMASLAVERHFSISSVGVGYDFNEVLMTALADQGAGRYYFLENPEVFAQVFEKEFQTARQVAAAGLEIRIPQKDGLRLIHAGGYPIAHQKDEAVFHAGDLLSGQKRNLFLTFEMPTDRIGDARIDTIVVRYRHQGGNRQLDAGIGLKVACVSDPVDVATSVDKETWSRQILQEDYSRLKADVADAIRKGERDQALDRIHEYETRNAALNDVVGSAAVSENLAKDIRQLEKKVKETFSGAPADVAAKKKQQAKTLQYDSYQIRRDQKK